MADRLCMAGPVLGIRCRQRSHPTAILYGPVYRVFWQSGRSVLAIWSANTLIDRQGRSNSQGGVADLMGHLEGVTWGRRPSAGYSGIVTYPAGAIEHNTLISDPSGGAADRPPHLRYTISQASPALRWIAWGSSDPGGPPGGAPNVSSAICGRILRVSENSSPRRLRRDHKIRDRRHDCGPAHRWSLISDAYPGICLSLGMPNMAVPILIITGPVAVSVRLLPFHGLGCLRYLRYPWWLWRRGGCGGCGGCGGRCAIPCILSPGLPGVPP